MYKAYTEFQKLKKVMIGRGLSTDVTRHPKLEDKLTPTTKRLLTYLLDETEEDYQSLVKICEDFGVKVIRPQYSFIDRLDPYLMNPRDEIITIDDSVVIVQEAIGTSSDYLTPLLDDKPKVKRNHYTFGLMPPSIVRLGKDIIVDRQDNLQSNTEKAVGWLKEWLEPLGYNIIYDKTHNFPFKAKISHSDGCLSIQKPGVLLTCEEASDYTDNIFKGWDAHQVDNSWGRMKNWISFKNDTKSYAFADDKYLDKSWNKLCTTWLGEWAGYAKETAFDVNVLSLDESHVVVSSYNEDVFKFFKKHKIEPIISPWRHRYFWDGGIHCITMDLEREGLCEQYL